MDGSSPSREDELAAEAFRSVFPNGLPKATPTSATALVRAFPLGEEHLLKLAAHAESGVSLNVDTIPRQKMTRAHHRLAQMLAMGMDEGRAGVLCNYGTTSVAILKTDPLFSELLDYYGSMVEDEFQTVAQQMADLSEDVVQEIRHRLENNPEQFTISGLNEVLKTLADRSGNGPTANVNTRNLNVNVTADELARIKAGNAYVQRDDRQPQALTSEDRQSLDSVFTLSAADVAVLPRPQGVGEGEGVGLRTEGGDEAADGMVANGNDPAPPVV